MYHSSMKIKYHTGVNFINIFKYKFFCINVVSAAFSSYVLALAKKIVQKMRAQNGNEIDGRVQESADELSRIIYLKIK
jgi:hypothetical protein